MPRLRHALSLAASGVVMGVAALALAPAHAQTPQVNQVPQPNQVPPVNQPLADDGDLFRLPNAATVFAPPVKQDLRAPGRFRRAKPAQQDSGGPTRFGQIPVYGNPPAFGAGTTGFDSTNAKRRKARAAIKQKPGVTLPLRPPPGVVPDPVPTTVQTRPSAQDQRRGASAVEVPAQTLVPTIATPTKRKAPPAEEDPFAPVGIRAGSFTFLPAVELTGGFDSNPSHVPGGKDSFLFTVAPELKVRSDWERHALNADIKGSYIAYAQTFGFNGGLSTGVPNSLDRPSLDSRVNGRLDVNSHSHFDMEGRLLLGTDNPGSPNIQAGLARLPIVTTLGSTFGYTQDFNRLQVTAKGTVDRSLRPDGAEHPPLHDVAEAEYRVERRSKLRNSWSRGTRPWPCSRPPPRRGGDRTGASPLATFSCWYSRGEYGAPGNSCRRRRCRPTSPGRTHC